MEAKYTLSSFTPGEAEAVTGLSTTMQRDWRRRDFLPRGDGHARFDCFDLARMLVMKSLADRGIGPQQSKPVADWCAAAICWEALGWKEAYEGDHERAHEWQPAALQPFQWGDKADWLRKQILRFKGVPRVIPARFFVWWANGDHVFTVDLTGSFNGAVSDDARVAGPVIVLDLNALGSALIDAAARPLVHVEFSAEPARKVSE